MTKNAKDKKNRNKTKEMLYRVISLLWLPKQPQSMFNPLKYAVVWAAAKPRNIILAKSQAQFSKHRGRIERGLIQLVDHCETFRILSARCTGYELVEVKYQRVGIIRSRARQSPPCFPHDRRSGCQRSHRIRATQRSHQLPHAGSRYLQLVTISVDKMDHSPLLFPCDQRCDSYAVCRSKQVRSLLVWKN